MSSHLLSRPEGELILSVADLDQSLWYLARVSRFFSSPETILIRSLQRYLAPGHVVRRSERILRCEDWILFMSRIRQASWRRLQERVSLPSHSLQLVLSHSERQEMAHQLYQGLPIISHRIRPLQRNPHSFVSHSLVIKSYHSLSPDDLLFSVSQSPLIGGNHYFLSYIC